MRLNSAIVNSLTIKIANSTNRNLSLKRTTGSGFMELEYTIDLEKKIGNTPTTTKYLQVKLVN